MPNQALLFNRLSEGLAREWRVVFVKLGLLGLAVVVLIFVKRAMI